MKAERWIQNEMKLINPLYFVVWDDLEWCWKVRKWKSVHPINQVVEHWRFSSLPILKMEYKHLDRRAVDAVARGLYHARKWKEVVLEIDRNNDNIRDKAALEDELIGRELAKSIWHYYKEPTIFLGG